MSTLITNTSDVTRFAAVFSAGDLAADVATQLSCIEVEALAGMLRAIGEPASADMWIEARAEGDDEGDDHYRAPVAEYVVPVDPMDALQCDSCQ